MPERPEIVNRGSEIAELRAIAAAGKPRIALLYGRRRVGKTFLLQRAFQGHRLFYFLAGDTNPEINKLDLLRELSEFAGGPLDPQDYPTWRTILRYLAELAAREPLVVVLDEFQHLMRAEDNIPSQISNVYEKDVGTRPLVLAISGSELSLMESLLDAGKALFGRWAWAAKLSPFDYFNAAGMFPGRSERDRAYFYGIFGGTPKYLAAVDPDESVEASAARTLLSPRGEVHLQVERVIEQERGIRATEEYNAVLRAIADGKVLVTEIEARTKVAGNPLNSILATLQRLEYIWRERNFEAARNAAWQYRIDDPALGFWFRFVQANRSRLAGRAPVEVWTECVKPQLDDHMGQVFPAMCRQGYERFHGDWGLPGVADGRWSRWEGVDRNRRPIELDIVARGDDGRILTGEIKWSSKPCGPSLHAELIRNLEDLANSGLAWAHEALAPETSAGYLYISAAGFAPEFHELAKQDSHIKLIELADLYRGA